MYINGSVLGYPVLLTTDTGASKTIRSKRKYDAVKREDRPILSKSVKLMGAGGTTVKR